MDLSTFIESRRPDWRRLEEILQRVEGSGMRCLDEEQAREFGRLYRRAASDLNQAQTFVRGDATAQYLNDLVARCYLVIYARRKIDVRAVLWHYLWAYPAVFRRYFGHFLLATAIFVGGMALGAAATVYERDVAVTYLMPANFPTIQPQTEEEAQHAPVMTAGETTQLTSFYFTNNTRVCLVVFALGITLGIGTAWVLFQTGLMTGVLAVLFAQAGQIESFAAEILPHGMVEIPAAILSGAAGFLLAEAIFRARPWPRVEELARAGKEALLLVSGCVPLLIAAAFLEAVVARSPQWLLPNALKLIVAGVVATAFLAYLLLLGWGKRAPARSAPP